MRGIFSILILGLCLIICAPVQARDLTPQEKAGFEAAIRKQLALPASAVFSDWSYRRSEGNWRGEVVITKPSQYGSSQGVYKEVRGFRSGQDGAVILDDKPVSKSDASIPFIEICKGGSTEQIKTAVDKGAILDAKDKNGDTALLIIARRNLGPELINLLASERCNIMDEMQQALNIYKKNKGNKNSIQALTDCISYCEAPAEGDQMACDTEEFINEVKTGNYENIKDILSQQRTVPPSEVKDYENEDNLLHIAARKNLGPKIVKLLLDAGVQSAARNKFNETPLDIYKKKKGNQESIRLLENPEKGKLQWTPKGKAIIEAEIRKHLTNPVSAKFTWFEGVASEGDPKNSGGGVVQVEIPNNPSQTWGVTLKSDGTLYMGAATLNKDGTPVGGVQIYKTHLDDNTGLVGKK